MVNHDGLKTVYFSVMFTELFSAYFPATSRLKNFKLNKFVKKKNLTISIIFQLIFCYLCYLFYSILSYFILLVKLLFFSLQIHEKILNNF